MVHAEWEGTILGPYWDAICNCRLSELQEILKIILSNSFILQKGKLSPRRGKKGTSLRSYRQVGTEQGLECGCPATQASALLMLPQCPCCFHNLCLDVQILLCLLCHDLCISLLLLKVREQTLKSDCLGFNTGSSYQLGDMGQVNQPFYASISSSTKWELSEYLPLRVVDRVAMLYNSKQHPSQRSP